MKFVCDRCQTRYSIADEKVRQKILRIRCKTCGNVIVVQGERASPSADEAGAEGASRPEHPAMAKAVASSAPKSMPSSTPKAAPPNAPKAAASSALRAAQPNAPKASLSSAPKLAPSSAPKAAPSSASKLTQSSSSVPKAAPSSASSSAAGGPPPLPPDAASLPDPLGGRAEWYLAIAGVRSGPFLRAEVARMILASAPGKTVHVWKEGMTGWKPSEEVSVIARELNLLRPPVEPPPHQPPPAPSPMPPGPGRAPSLPAAGPLKVAAMPAKAARSAKVPESQTESLFPGKPLKPSPAGISDSLDFTVETDSGAFADITTRKTNGIRALSNASDKGSFADVTTKKGKSLRDLEAEPLFSSAPAFIESEKTPPPVHPLPAVARKAVETGPAASSSANLPAAAPALSFNPPGMVSAATSSSALPVVPAVPSSPSELGGFDEVMRAVALGDQASGPQDFAEPIIPAMPLLAAPFPAPISSELGISAAASRPGLKYVVAVCAIVALVILIVMVTLRMDSRKVTEPEPEPAPAKEPAAAPEPKPATDELPKPEPAAEGKPGQGGTRAGGKHGSGKSSRRVDVGPVPERQPTQKQPAAPVLAPRPNPFDESKTVSQSQISSVVRNKANQAGLKSCYERALKMDNHLTSGRIDVTVSIATSGAVQRVVVNAPASFILVEPCIKSAVKRWVFPPNIEEYATNFPLIMQGGM